jgi:hypothetical protein
MNRRYASIVLVLVGLTASGLACNAPTPTPEASPTRSPQETPTSLRTQTPLEGTSTPVSTATEGMTPASSPLPTVTPLTPTATITPTETATPTPPISTGPLDFPAPTRLDHWQALADSKYECQIILQITGGAPPYTVHHDLEVFETWQNRPALVFTAHGCGAIVHTIRVDSADGQTVTHDYYISAPWCED